MEGELKIRGYTVGQRPNPPLWVALVAFLVALLSGPGGTVHGVARAVAYVALTVWAYEELTGGVNGFRRALGAVAIAYIVVVLARSFA